MIRLSRWLSLLTTRNSISPFLSSITAGFSGKGIAGALPFFGIGSGESLLVLTLLLSEGVFGSSVAFRLEARQQLGIRLMLCWVLNLLFSLIGPILVGLLADQVA